MMMSSATHTNGRGRRFGHMFALAVLGFTAGSGYALAQTTIEAGSDLWTTPGGGSSVHDFSENPIAEDFFFSGSPAFDGILTFKHVPIGEALLPDVDTIIDRYDPFTLDGPGSEASVAVGIVLLNIESDPFMVGDTEWIASLQLSDEQDDGTMTIRQEDENGGTFDLDFPVRPRYTFHRGPDFTESVVLDGSEFESSNLRFAVTDARWVFDTGDTQVVKLTNPLDLEFFPGVTVQPTSSNFFPGLAHADGISRCTLTVFDGGLDALWARLPVLIGGDETDDDGDGVRNDCDNCRDQANSLQEDADGNLVGDACDEASAEPTMLLSDYAAEEVVSPCRRPAYARRLARHRR